VRRIKPLKETIKSEEAIEQSTGNVGYEIRSNSDVRSHVVLWSKFLESLKNMVKYFSYWFCIRRMWISYALCITRYDCGKMEEERMIRKQAVTKTILGIVASTVYSLIFLILISIRIPNHPYISAIIAGILVFVFSYVYFKTLQEIIREGKE